MDLSDLHTRIAVDLSAAFTRVVASSGFILGEEVERFEDEFAQYCGVANCVGVASGTAALTLALQAAGVGRGDEVIVPAHTFIASAFGVLHAGARVAFCDVDEETGLIDVGSAATQVNERTAAIVAVHLYGQPSDMSAVTAFAKKHDLLVLEDAAQAHGAEDAGSRVGALGDAAAFSFYPSKNLGALGDAGAICTDNDGIAEVARRIRNLGQRRKGEHLAAGWNERLDGLQAAFLSAKLPHLDTWNAHRRAVARRYHQGLQGRVRMLEEVPGRKGVYHLFPIRVADRDEMARRLDEAGVETGVHYSPSVPAQPPFRDAAFPPEAFPCAEAWAREELSLPMGPSLEDADVDRVVAACLAAGA